MQPQFPSSVTRFEQEFRFPVSKRTLRKLSGCLHILCVTEYVLIIFQCSVMSLAAATYVVNK